MYEMSLGGIRLPILPENLKEIIQMDNKKFDILGLGERVLSGKEKLHTWTLSSYFPAEGKKSVKECKDCIESQIRRDYNGVAPVSAIEPVKFSILRWLSEDTVVFDVIVNVLIESLEWEDRQGEPGDLYFTIKLIEYKKFDAKEALR